MAERAGAQLVNMRYIQTYPICDPISGAIELIANTRFNSAVVFRPEGERLVRGTPARTCEAILSQTGPYLSVL